MSVSNLTRRRRSQLIHGRVRPLKTSRSAVVYKNPKASIERRLKDLLSRMTVQEKADQMMCIWQQKASALVDDQGNFDLHKAKSAFKRGRGIGQVGRPSDAIGGLNARRTAELANAIQRFFLKHSRLGIPV